jgi:hypothetical protein
MTVPTAARVLGCFVFVSTLFVAGCSERKKSTGSVAGKVTYKGNPVTAGDVTFRSSSGEAATGKIEGSGQFKLSGPLAAGEYQVFVTPPLPEPQAPGTKAAAPTKFELPQKFRDPSSSGVTVLVKAGDNDIPVAFKD